eukprot:6104110-Pleurochrysis_carterae.AAC.3
MNKRRSQQATVPTSAIGTASNIHWPKPMERSNDWRAAIETAFCGAEMGVSMPPRLHENASPRSTARV